ncbi:hypothetical protein ACJRO7_004303 [Eucalyptus globulus]|uniref:Secreted protein n=1 Tax=Eucalyptus globulus TaxID=34317 RepID=A0ABD3IWZ2_EUCGL
MTGDWKNMPWFKTFFSFLALPVRADHSKHPAKRTAPEAAIVAASKHFSAPHKVTYGKFQFFIHFKLSKSTSRRRRRRRRKLRMVAFSSSVAERRIGS